MLADERSIHAVCRPPDTITYVARQWRDQAIVAEWRVTSDHPAIGIVAASARFARPTRPHNHGNFATKRAHAACAMSTVRSNVTCHVSGKGKKI